MAEKNGTIRSVSSSGRPGAQPFLDLRSRVTTSFFRGILGFKVDPDFAAHPFVYVAYTPKLAGEKPTGPTVVRISRFRVADGRAVPSSERVIVGGDDAKPCAALPPSADCLPSSLDVDGADIVFAPDGTLFVSTGFGGGEEHVEPSAFLAEDREASAGRSSTSTARAAGCRQIPSGTAIRRATGPRCGRRASGTRSAWRCSRVAHDPRSRRCRLGLVRVAPPRRRAAATHGWPCFEGGHKTPEYRDTPRCADYYRAHPEAPNAPWLAIPHPPGIAITGGVPLTRASGLPADLRSDYAFADWGAGTLTLVPLGETSNPKQIPLARSAAGPVRLRVGPDGALYYLAANSGDLRRIAAR